MLNLARGPPEGSVGVGGDLIVEIEQGVQLLVLHYTRQEVLVLLFGLGETVDIVQTVENQPHCGVRDLVLAQVVAVTAALFSTVL